MAWVAPVIQAVGAIGGGLASSHGQASANAANRAMAMRQMAFQQFMASHAHGIEMNDLRRSGLNPILTATGGSGASTPSGASATMENTAGVGVSTALDALTKLTDAFATRAQTDKTKAETDLTIARTATERQQPANVAASTGLISEQTNTAKATQANIAADTRLKTLGQQVSMSEINKNNEMTKLLTKQGITQDLQSQLLSVNVAQASEILKGLRLDGQINSSTYGEVLRYIDRTLESVGRGLDAVHRLKSPVRSRAGRDSRDYPSYR